MLQPHAALHERVPSWFKDDDETIAIRFYQLVRQQAPEHFEFHDFSSIFDEYFDEVPVRNHDLEDDTIFVDTVHLTDRGNEIVARRLAGLLE